jgi:peptidylprolyl isomerase
MTSIRLKQPTNAALVLAVVIGLASQAYAQTAPAAQPRQVQARPKPAPVSSPMAAQAAIAAPAQGTATGQATGDDAIARVGNINVSAESIRAYVAALNPRDQAALAKDPALLSQAVRQMLANQLVLQEARAKKWDQQPNVAAQLDRVRESALVELYLQAVSVPPQNFPSDEDVQKVYDANREALLMPRQFELAQIFVADPKGTDRTSDDKVKKSVDDILRKAKAPGADFATIAADAGTPNGGNLGWLVENQIVPEIRSQIQGLAKGAFSDPIRLDDGWHIVKLIDTKASYTRTLPEVREQLVVQIRNERMRMLRQAYLAEILKKNPPAINELALSKIMDTPSR